MSSSYRALLARPGAWSVALSCALGWLSFASYALATVLAVEAATRSFAAAGATVAALSAGAGLLAPARGRLVDRRGPRALAYFVPGHAAGLGLLVLGCASSQPAWMLCASAALAGAFAPPLIATARAVWPRVAGPDLARTGHALNLALGDAAQVVGPVLTAALAALVSPLFALAILAPGAMVGAIVLSRFPARGAEGAPAAAVHRVWGVLGESAGLRTLVICELALGLSLGALEVAAPALAAEAGAAELAAVPLAVFALGSIAASVWSGGRRPPRAASWRYVTGYSVFAAALLCCLPARSLAAVTAVLVIAGAGYGLLNVAMFELLDGVARPHRAVEALTWITTWEAVGLAGGAGGAGQLSRGGGSDTLILVAVPAALAAAAVIKRLPTLKDRAVSEP